MLNKKSMVEKRIEDALNNAKHKNIGYISVKINGININYFNVNDEEVSLGLQYPITNENMDNILLSEKVKLYGDFYGDSFTGFLVETIDFITK